MFVGKRLHIAFVYFSIGSMICPAPVVLAEAPNSGDRVVVHDVRLDEQGLFHGMIVDAQGRPMLRRDVILKQAQRRGLVSRQPSDKAGRFSFGPLAAGTYHLQTSQGLSVCRLWTSKGAPPRAAKTLLVVDDANVERGQHPIRNLYTSDPILMATVVAAAIAIPIAIHKSRDDAPPGS